MESMLFYWFLWGAWIIAAFLMNKGKERDILVFGILIVLILSGWTFSAGTIELNAGYLTLIFSGYVLLKNTSISNLLYYVLSDLVITILYVLIHIYLLMDPAILIIVNQWLFLSVLSLIILILVKPFYLRISTVLIGVGQGAVLKCMVFYPYEHTLGDKESFDALALTLLIIITWSGFRQFLHWLEQIFQKPSARRFTK
ncbi:hypothetical protein ACFO4N_03665 [Camelliibacillus cellulosilyticus]|uniref:Uncharacterized protein n=1 Tax=Camelliibacillus cellulosilyticus TaxID=2174486 RepID=A0ABV9GLP9_9BACL